MKFRSAIAPTLLIMGLIACDVESSAQQTASQSDLFDENNDPGQTVIEEIRWRCQAFLTEHNPECSVQGFTFNQLTPNVYLIGANVKDSKTNTSYVKHMSVEKLKDIREDEDGDMHEMDEKVFAIDYADPFKMAQIAERHGFAQEVRDVHGHNVNMCTHNAGYNNYWLDDYLIWSTLYGRPNAYYYGYGSGFTRMAPGYRSYVPMSPLNVAAIRGSGWNWLPARSGGRSYAFSSGISRNPPNVTRLSGNSSASVFSSSGGKSAPASVARGGFGGRSGGFSSGG